MTDEEKVTAIESLLNGPACNWAVQHTTPAETLARTREIATCMLAILNDVPSVEWTTDPHRVVGITRDAEIVILPDGPREPPGHRILITGLVEDT